jgi:hypothetical protein
MEPKLTQDALNEYYLHSFKVNQKESVRQWISDLPDTFDEIVEQTTQWADLDKIYLRRDRRL